MYHLLSKVGEAEAAKANVRQVVHVREAEPKAHEQTLLLRIRELKLRHDGPHSTQQTTAAD